MAPSGRGRSRITLVAAVLALSCTQPTSDLPQFSRVALSFADAAPAATDRQGFDPALRRLREAAERYEAMSIAGGWPAVAAGPPLQIGAHGDRVRMLRARLDAEGDPRERVGPGDSYDGSVIASVRHFQRRHGIEEDGVVGSETLAALNVSAVERTQKLRRNVVRRESAGLTGTTRVVVNVPAFELEATRDGRSAFKTRVIVGARHACTPTLASEITHAIVNPYWHVPHRLARKEILPLLRRDPEYAAKEHLRVFRRQAGNEEVEPAKVDWQRVSSSDFPFRLRQDPGPWNALGRIAFVFPNRFHVFLHDTPKQDLFARTVRAFSHGCIRVENPVELAEAVLHGDSAWDRRRILAAIESGETRTIRFTEPVPIDVVYWTAWVDEDGTVEFRADLCGRDVEA